MRRDAEAALCMCTCTCMCMCMCMCMWGSRQGERLEEGCGGSAVHVCSRVTNPLRAVHICIYAHVRACTCTCRMRMQNAHAECTCTLACAHAHAHLAAAERMVAESLGAKQRPVAE